MTIEVVHGPWPLRNRVEEEKIGILPLWEVGFAQMPSILWASLKCLYETSPTRYNAISRFKWTLKIFEPKFKPSVTILPLRSLTYSLRCHLSPSRCSLAGVKGRAPPPPPRRAPGPSLAAAIRPQDAPCPRRRLARRRRLEQVPALPVAGSAAAPPGRPGALPQAKAAPAKPPVRARPSSPDHASPGQPYRTKVRLQGALIED